MLLYRSGSILLAFLFCLSSAQAQEEVFAYSLDAPYAAMVTHLGCLLKQFFTKFASTFKIR